MALIKFPPGWSVTKDGYLSRRFIFSDYNVLQRFINFMMGVAKFDNHHPEFGTLAVKGQHQLRVRLKTQDKNKITNLDIEQAELLGGMFEFERRNAK